MWTPVEEIQWFFGLEDFFNPLRLIKKIVEGDDPVSKYLRSGLNVETRKLFESNINGPYLGLLQNPMTLDLINELDRALESPALYEPNRFAGMKVPEEASQLIGRSLTKDDQIRLNRILLDTAYPDEIRRSGRIKGLAAEIIHFFAHEHLIIDSEGNQAPPKTLRDFLDSCPNYHYEEHPHLGFEIRKLCHNLIGEGLLYPAGFDPTQRIPLNERFFSDHLIRDMAVYGSYEFAAFGFTKIREHFCRSVVKLLITKNGQEYVGTGFLLNDDCIVTAAHCLPEKATLAIEGWDPVRSPLIRVVTLGEYGENPFVLKRGKVDIAVLKFEADPFPGEPKFELWQETVLDDVLVMGYPSLSGFRSGLIASKGEIISKEKSTARNQELIIFSAGVKGGNSGGPVINRLGKVVGIVTDLLNEKDIRKLGYGLATPAPGILDVANLAKGREVKDKQAYSIDFELEESIIKIKN